MSRVVIIAASLGVGLLAGWKARSPAVEASSTLPATTPPRTEADRPKGTKDDLLKLTRGGHWSGMKHPLAAKLTDWSTEEIRAALEKSLKMPECRMPGDPANKLPDILMAAWIERDFTAARVWFETLPPGKTKEQMAKSLAMHWPREKGGEALDYLLANREVMKDASFWLVTNATQHAVDQGAAALVPFMSRLRETGFEYPNTAGGGFPMAVEYPADFDFAVLMASDEFKSLPKEHPDNIRTLSQMLLSQWHIRDRDAAYQWILENYGVSHLKILAWNHQVDLEPNQRWLAAKADALSPADKETFRAGVMSTWVLQPDRLLPFIQATKDPALVNAARDCGVQAIFYGNTHRALPAFDGMDSEARLQLLEQAELNEEIARDRPGYRKFDDADEAQLRKKLAEWNASPERTEAIVSRFKLKL